METCDFGRSSSNTKLQKPYIASNLRIECSVQMGSVRFVRSCLCASSSVCVDSKILGGPGPNLFMMLFVLLPFT